MMLITTLVVSFCKDGRVSVSVILCFLVVYVRCGHTEHTPLQTSCKMGTGSFLGVKWGRGVLLTSHPLLVPRSWKSKAIPLLTLWATPGL